MAEFWDLSAWLPALWAMIGGTLLGFIFGLVPGIGGRTGIILSLPIAMLFEPHSAAIFLFAMHSVVHTGSSIPAIAFGLPSSAADAATVIDGHPLAKMGRAGEALGASLSASAIGGALGALAFLAAIPVARPLVSSFAAPEFFMLSLLGITMVSSLSREGLLPGLVVAAVGMIFAMVGVSQDAVNPRFSFGLLELWDGLDMAALVCGLFVVPEMLTVEKTSNPEDRQRAVSTSMRDVYRGMLVTFRHKAVLLRSTLYGIVIGLTPAVGSSVAVWLSYGYAAQSTKSEIPFGKGAIAGVIAPEAANNAKEGGAMIPTLLFAIPGSSSMAIMLGALNQVGVQAGLPLLTSNIGLSYGLAAAVLVANLLAIPAFFAVVPGLVRLSSLKREFIAPIAIALSVTAAMISAPMLSTLFQIVIASLLGLALKRAGWPRAPFILGFVVGRLAEQSFHQTAAIWGWTALQRPITVILTVVLVGSLAYVAWSRPAMRLEGPRQENVLVAGGLAAFFALVMMLASRLSVFDGFAPFLVGLLGAGLALAILIRFLLTTRVTEPREPINNAGLFIAFVLAIPVAGLFLSSFSFITAVLWQSGVKAGLAGLTAAIFVGLQFIVLAVVFDVVIEREIVGRIAWSFLF